MKKSVLIIISLLLLILVGSMLLLRSYRLDLVQNVVVTALIQKAPENYSRQEIHRTFQAALGRAENRGREQAYLEQLLQVSQRLEKVQQLSQEEIDQLLESLDSDENEPL